MPFLPSLLEYTPQALHTRLSTIQSNQTKFLSFQQSAILGLHLDFVLPQFALSRGVQHGNSLEVVFAKILEFFGNQPVILNVHFMGLDDDMKQVFEFLQGFEMPVLWQMTLFVDQKYSPQFELLVAPKKTPKNQNNIHNNITIGNWLDLGEYNKNTCFLPNKSYLLMTVFAGKSGQKLTQEVQETALIIVQTNSESTFTLDGGWSVDFINTNTNLNIVSYSSLWNSFEASL